MSGAWRTVRAKARAAWEAQGGRMRTLLLHRALPVLLGLIAALGIFNRVVMPRFVRQGEEIRMPDLRGKTRPEAQQILEGLSLSLRDTVTRVTADIPRGVVIDQDPAPEASIKTDRGVRLVLSRGREELKVPALAGQTLRFTRLNLGEEGYAVGDVVRAPSREVPRDCVIASDPPAGTLVEPGRRIHLLVSDGPEGRYWIMPDLRNQDLRLTAERLRGAGFTVVIDDEDPFEIRPRRVEATIPRPGDPMRGTGTVHLIGG